MCACEATSCAKVFANINMCGTAATAACIQVIKGMLLTAVTVWVQGKHARLSIALRLAVTLSWVPNACQQRQALRLWVA